MSEDVKTPIYKRKSLRIGVLGVLLIIALASVGNGSAQESEAPASADTAKVGPIAEGVYAMCETLERNYEYLKHERDYKTVSGDPAFTVYNNEIHGIMEQQRILECSTTGKRP